jgi:anti-anti-sigma factor
MVTRHIFTSKYFIETSRSGEKEIAMPIKPGLECKEKRGYLWITLPAKIDKENVSVLRGRIESEMMIRDAARVVLDCSRIEMITSTAIDLIMFFHGRITGSSGVLYVTNLSGRCMMQLQSVNLDRVLTICEREDGIPRAGKE